MRTSDEPWALFWCTLLHPVIFGEIAPEDTPRFLKTLAAEEKVFPNGVRKKPSLSTLRRKLRIYREGGFEALARKSRSDRGTPRAHTREVIDLAIELKRDQPLRSHIPINQFLRALRGTTVPKSSLYRHLKRAGATRQKLGVTKKKVRRRWTRDTAHALWVGDFEDGPYVLHGEQAVPTYLSAFIDCHSRFIVEARYYYRHSLDILIDSLLRAWAVHGASEELYLDNAKVYHAHALKMACYALHIHLLHRTKGDPPPGGLIEKFFQTVQSQFESEVRAGPIRILDQLNRAFAAWLEVSYHREIHSETGQPPRERLEQGRTVIRRVDMEAVLRYFMKRVIRTVHRDFSDVQLDGRFYRVDKRLRGDKVQVRYDPFSPADVVYIYSAAEQYLGKGVLHHREEGEAGTPPPPHKPHYSYLDLLVRLHDEELRAKTGGIDYRKAVAQRPWPFPAFVKTLAPLLGRRGDLSAFNAEELECLRKLFARLPSLTPAIVEEAVAQAPIKTISSVAHEMEKLVQRKET
jgi:transposase InsO family protein